MPIVDKKKERVSWHPMRLAHPTHPARKAGTDYETILYLMTVELPQLVGVTPEVLSNRVGVPTGPVVVNTLEVTVKLPANGAIADTADNAPAGEKNWHDFMFILALNPPPVI